MGELTVRPPLLWLPAAMQLQMQVAQRQQQQ
jgi:hypothetical protein